MQNDFTIHIALSNTTGIPNSEDSYLDIIHKEIYTAYKDNNDKFYKTKKQKPGDEQIKELLYNPLKYYIFGNYDAAFVSLVDRFKFSQRLFSTKADQNSNNSFQIITGVCLSKNEKKGNELQKLFSNFLQSPNKVPPYIGICNLKLNNSFLLGNGNQFLESISKKIDEVLTKNFTRKKQYLILQSFSWFEITVLIFTDTIDDIGTLLYHLRKLRLSDLGEETLANRSLYKTLYDYENESINNSHLIVDTHTYTGICSNYIDNDKLFTKLLKNNNSEIKTEVEWQVKPGHLHHLIALLQKGPYSKGIFELEDILLVTGKSDYIIETADENCFRASLKFFKSIAKKNDYSKHVRKIKTRLLFNSLELAKNTATDSSKEGVTDFIERLKELAIPVGKIIAINEQLKKLKVSRQIRAKVIKIFHNYNNGIQDPVLYTYFLDFGFFISNLIKRVKHYSNQFDRILKDNSDYVDINTQEIESNLFKLIDIFQESFNIRMLNCFKYEDITDFDLDFNSSIQQLLTTYNTVAIAIGNNIYAKEEEEVLYGPIVRLNFKNTVSSYDSINYNVYNFLSPEVVFFTVVKEIMNHFSVQKELGFNKEIDILKGDFEKGIKSINYLLDYYESGLIDFDYYFIDIIRYIIVCNHDISLFQYWFWQINLQNSSMYDAIGVMRENHFKVELFRICFLAKLFDEQTFLECPIPELENYWERYYHKTIEAIDLLFDKSPQLITQFRKLTFEQAGRYLQTIQNNDVKEVILSFKSKNNYMTNDSDYKQEQFRKKIDEFIKEIEIESAPREYGFQSKLSFSLTYYNDYLSIFKNLNKQAIEDGQPILYKKETHGHPIAYLNGLMYSYLFHLLEKNKKINFLRRSWSDGKPLKSFIEVSNSDALYFIDQTGSIFFTDSAKVNQYFKMRNGVLQSLFDFSNKQKVQIFKKIKTLMSN